MCYSGPHNYDSLLLYEIWLLCSQVSDLIGKIQQAYVETLEELSWMDTPSKEKAREKVSEEAKPKIYGFIFFRCSI